MCKISNKLKLCTCKTDIYRLKHYWIFHRFVKGKNEIVIGQVMMPPDINPADDRFNRALLLDLLNDGNVFDVEMNPLKKDRLQISFQIRPGDENIVYGFQYNGSQWKKQEYDPLMWMWHHDEAAAGKIVHALERRNQK